MYVTIRNIILEVSPFTNPYIISTSNIRNIFVHQFVHQLKVAGDAYDISINTKHRDTIKELFNAMVQMKQFTDHPPRIKCRQTGKTCKQLRDMILKRHEPIKHMFFCGMGNNLQYRDSIIAEQVMLHFAKNDIPVLPVHDSFIITAGLFIDLLEVMEKEFKKTDRCANRYTVCREICPC